MKTKIILPITHTKPIEDILDKVAGRVYTLDGIGGNGDVVAAFKKPKKKKEKPVELCKVSTEN